MADIGYLLKGYIIGFIIAAPFGPVGVLCMRRTLTRGPVSGMVSGLGAATADLMYAAVSAFGLTFISDFLVGKEHMFRLIGGIILLSLGIRFCFSRPKVGAQVAGKNIAIGDYFSTFIITATNPVTVVLFVAVFTGLGIINPSVDYICTSMLVLGVFLGSVSSWFLLSQVVNVFRNRISDNILGRISRVAGVVLTAFGIVAILSIVKK